MPHGFPAIRLQIPVAWPRETTRFELHVSGACEDTVFVTVTVHPLPEVIAETDKEIRHGENVTLGRTNNDNFAYQWFPETGLSSPFVPQPVAAPDSSVTYVLTVTDRGTGCRNYDTVKVTVIDNIWLKILGGGEFCHGTSVRLSAESDTDTVFWFDPNGELLSDRSECEFAAEVTGWYFAVARQGRIESRDSVYVRVRKFALVVKDMKICEGESVELVAETHANIASWSWTPADGLTGPLTPRPIAKPDKTTTYTVTATDEFGCSNTATLTVNVTLKEKISFAIGEPTEAYPGSETKLLLTINSEEKISSLKGKIFFDGTMLSLSRKNVSSNSFGWNLDVRESSPGVIEFSGSGVEISSGEMLFPLFVYLSGRKETELRLEIEEPQSGICRIIGKKNSVFAPDKVCADSTRTVKVSGEIFSLGEVHPHPATAETKIFYSVAFPCHVKITLTNSMGEEIFSFVDEEKTPGRHELSLPKELSTGVYFIRMTAGDFVETRAMALER